jgi:hypothetical protein
MVRQTWWILTGIFSAGLLISSPAIAQDKTQNHPGSTVPAALPAADSTKFPTPQESLTKLAGEYTRIIKFVGQGNAAPSTGSAKISAVLGGKFILEESSDTVFGRHVEGMRIYGYDDAAKQYQMVRMYTMSTAITTMNGTSNDGGKTIDFTGEAETSGAGKTPLHAHLRRMSNDQFAVTLSTIGPDGKESPFQETDYTRKK